jgi:hypothetical protein
MKRWAHLPILALLAAALFLRALVPVGWMPAANAGVFAIQPCPAAEPAQAVAHHHHGSSHSSHDGDCAFAPLHAGFAPADAAPILTVAAAIAEPPLAHPAVASFPTGPPAPPPPATGPPAIA